MLTYPISTVLNFASKNNKKKQVKKMVKTCQIKS